jgi:hypothetical protein
VRWNTIKDMIERADYGDVNSKGRNLAEKITVLELHTETMALKYWLRSTISSMGR